MIIIKTLLFIPFIFLVFEAANFSSYLVTTSKPDTVITESTWALGTISAAIFSGVTKSIMAGMFLGFLTVTLLNFLLYHIHWRITTRQ